MDTYINRLCSKKKRKSVIFRKIKIEIMRRKFRKNQYTIKINQKNQEIFSSGGKEAQGDIPKAELTYGMRFVFMCKVFL